MPAMFTFYFFIALLTLSTLNDFGEKTLFPQPKSVSSGSLRSIPTQRG